MATFIFDGTQNVTTAFSPPFDTVQFNNINAADVRSFSSTGTTTTLVLNSGVALTLTGVTFEQLTSADFVAGTNSNINVQIGAAGDNTVANTNALTGNVVVGLAGNDNPITASTNGAILYGNQGNDTLAGGTFTGVRIFGGQDNDSITGGLAGSVVFGGAGIDTIVGGNGGVTLYGGNGAGDLGDLGDSITGGTGNDVIFGNAGDDTIAGGGGRDTIYGGQGNDGITLAATNTTGTVIYGGLGTDVISAAGATGITANTDGVTIFGGNGAGDTQDGGDTLTGTLGNDLIYGNGGNDIIVATGGRDTIYGGQGNDTIAGAGGAGTGTVSDGSVIYGGLGSDVINVNVAASTGLTTATTQIFGGNGLADAADGADQITIGTQVAGIQVFGNGGNDTIVTNATLVFNDTISGGAGNDTITAGAGNDQISGGLGSDTFVFLQATSTDANTIDRVTDFDANADKIDLFDNGVTSVITINVTNASSVAEIKAASSEAANTITVVNVTGGALAGTYISEGQQVADTVVNITGFTGTIDATDFI